MAYTTPRTWVTGETVTAALLNTHVRDNLNALVPDGVDADTWSPVIQAVVTGPIAVDTTSGRQYQLGALMTVYARFSGFVPSSGGFFVTLPAAAVGLAANSAFGSVIGSWRGHDASTVANSQSGAVILSADGTNDTVRFMGATGGAASDSSPFTWTTGDVLSFTATYPVA